MQKRVSRLVAVGLMSALMALFAAPAPAMAAVPVGPVYDSGGGMSIAWDGYWESKNRLSNIFVEICDSAPNNTNEATAAFRVKLKNPSTGADYMVTAPARLKVLQYDTGGCAYALWDLGYAHPIVSVTLWFWGDSYPSQIWGSKPQANPYR